ncbi:Hpt domain-containing protein [Pelagicoccus mobilis]|uniref:Hpt domain-containing protein n=1 Tax=Pelagicoccus mobilis TaxID=415221 RepID=A0A934S0A3_9BACT|nr:Hpt domain-containing protein [Pelagicoccus mobilis]MBK1878191.1 Hpt domain-containing protein [Pelagicoccus mobilis]
MSDSELIDWEQLEMIFGEDEEDFDEDMAELFHEFVEDGNIQFGKINESEFAADKTKVAKESHKLKGSASNFGFTRVASLLAHIEDEIESITRDDFLSSLEQARSGFDRSIATVMERYPALGVGQN